MMTEITKPDLHARRISVIIGSLCKTIIGRT